MHLRPYQLDDGPTLTSMNPDLTFFQLDDLYFHQGYAWVIEVGGDTVGYAAAIPTAGLPGLVALDGLFVTPTKRGQGLGGQALHQMCQELGALGLTSLSYPVNSLDSPAGRLLLRNGFTIEHEEIRMVLDNLHQLPPVQLPAGAAIVTFSFPLVSQHFRQLYEESFGGTPSYQPYNEVELIFGLPNPADMLFLQVHGQLVGFVWTQLEGEVGVIEPLGVVAGQQGRGYGRLLLLAGLHSLAQQGAQRGRLGVFASNRPAVHLYESVGFRPVSTLTYLHRQLSPAP